MDTIPRVVCGARLVGPSVWRLFVAFAAARAREERTTVDRWNANVGAGKEMNGTALRG